MIRDYFFLGLKNLRKRSLRSWLTIIGIFIAIATIFMLISISTGLQEAIAEQFRTLGTDKFFIMPKGQLGAPGTGGAVQLTTEDFDTVEKVSGVKQATYFVGQSIKIEFNGKIRYFIAAGTPKERFDLFKEVSSLEVMDGKPIESAKKGEVALGSLYAGDLFGKSIEAGDTIKINDQNVRVNSILKSIGNPSDDQNVYMFMDTFEELFGPAKSIDEIIVQVQPGQDIKEVQEKVDRRLMKFRGVTEKTKDYSIISPEDLLASFGTILNIVTAFLVGIAAISLVVGGVGIMNTMYTSVLERTKEIGVMKAIGAKNSDILTIFLMESGLLGLVGGIIGVALGYAGAKIIEIIATNALGTNLLRAATPLWLIFGCLLFAFLAGAVSGIWPAWLASRTRPVDALRYE